MRRFVACAAENGIDVFRLHDPLNDVSNLVEAGEAIVEAGRQLHVGLVYSPGRAGEVDALVEQARKVGALGASRVLLNDPTGGLLPHVTQELVERLREASGLPGRPLHPGGGGHGARQRARRDPRRGRRCRDRGLPARARRCTASRASRSSRRSRGSTAPTGVDVARLWEASDVVDEHIGDEPLAPLAPRIAVRAAEYDLPAGPRRGARRPPPRARRRAIACSTRSTEVVRIRDEAGRPPLAAPIGQILGSQALLNVLSARRYGTVLDEFRQLVTGGVRDASGRDRPRRAPRGRAARPARRPALDDDPPSVDDVREAAEGLASSEEDLVLLAMFGEEAETLLQTIRQRHSREASLLGGDVDAQRGERIRELVKIVQESGVGEIEIEDEGMRVSVRRADEPGSARVPAAAASRVAEADDVAPSAPRRRDDPRRVADGRRLLPCGAAGRAAVRRGGRRRRRRADALRPRGDEALQRAQGRRATGACARSTPTTDRRSSSGRSSSSSSRSSLRPSSSRCSPASSSRTGARSRCA